MKSEDGARSRNCAIATGILSGVIGRSVSLLAPFIVMPAMLRYLGDASFGVWMTAVSITSMAMFVDFGVGNGLLTKLSKAFGEADYASMRSYIASAYVALSSIAVGLLVLLAASLLSAHFGWITKIAFYANHDSLGILVICIATFIVGVPASVIQKIMYACQITWISNMWQVFGAVLSTLLCLLAIRAALTPWQVIAAYSLPPLMTMCLSAIWYFREHPELRPRTVDFSTQHTGDLLRTGMRFFALAAITSIALNADNLIIAQRLGAEAVTEYAVPAKLASLLGLLVTTLFLPLWAANGEALARKDHAWIKQSTFKMSLYGGLVVLGGGLLLVSCGGVVIRMWMGREFDSQTVILLFFSILSFFMAITSPFNMVLNSLAVIRPQFMSWSLFLIISIPLKYYFLESGKLWWIPMISAILYLFIISIPIMGYVLKKIDSFSINKIKSDKIKGNIYL